MSDQFNISGFPKLLRLKLAHLAIDAGKKLNQYIIHICWEHVREKEKAIPESDKFVCAEKGDK